MKKPFICHPSEREYYVCDRYREITCHSEFEAIHYLGEYIKKLHLTEWDDFLKTKKLSDLMQSATSMLNHLEEEQTALGCTAETKLEFVEKLLYSKFFYHEDVWICYRCWDLPRTYGVNPEYQTLYDLGVHIEKLHPRQWMEVVLVLNLPEFRQITKSVAILERKHTAESMQESSVTKSYEESSDNPDINTEDGKSNDDPDVSSAMSHLGGNILLKQCQNHLLQKGMENPMMIPM